MTPDYENKINRRYCVGCGTFFIILILAITILYFIFWYEPNAPIKGQAVEYIIENLDDFKDDFAQMGYDSKIAYTLYDIWGKNSEYDNDKLGYNQKRNFAIV